MNKIKQFIDTYRSILVLKKSHSYRSNLKRYILVYAITFFTMGLIFSLVFPGDAMTENLTYVVMATITTFLGSFLVALFDEEETYQKTNKLSYSIKTVMFFKGLEKATIIFISMSFIVNTYFKLLAPTYLIVMLFVIAIILFSIMLLVNQHMRKTYAFIKHILIDSISTYLFFIIVSRVIYIENIFIAFVTYALILLCLISIKNILKTYEKPIFTKLNIIKNICFAILIVAFITLYNADNHNVLGKPIINNVIDLEMSNPGGIGYKVLILDEKVYVLNRHLYVYDLNTGGNEVAYLNVIANEFTSMLVYDNRVHVRYGFIGDEPVKYGYFDQSDTFVEEDVDASCIEDDFLQLGYTYTLPMCLPTEQNIYLTEDIYYLEDTLEPRALSSTIDYGSYFSNPITRIAYDNYMLAKLNTNQLVFNANLKLYDVTETNETYKQTLRILNKTQTINLMNIENDISTFIYGNDDQTSTVMTYDSFGNVLEYLNVYDRYMDFQTDDENIYIITLADDTFNYQIHVLNKYHYVDFVMPKFINTDDDGVMLNFMPQSTIHLSLEIIFSLMIVWVICIPPVNKYAI
jgi:hypothetical protein